MSHVFTNGYAVIIGVGADLPVTIQDARAIADLLRDQARCSYPLEHVQLLTGERATRSHILQALDRLADQTKQDPHATAIIYFSGHGIEMPDFHLLPFGYDVHNLQDTAITGRLLTDKLRVIPSQKLVVLLDCCHAGGQADIKTHSFVESPLPRDTFDELKRSSGRVLIASSRKDEFSWTGQPYSVFTTAVLESLAGYGAFEQDGYARILDVALYVGRFVPERTKDRQHPIIKISNVQDNFALAYYAAGAAAPKRLNWSTQHLVRTKETARQYATRERMLTNRREALLLMQERMSEYVEYQDIPLQLLKNVRRTEEEITELEQKPHN